MFRHSLVALQRGCSRRYRLNHMTRGGCRGPLAFLWHLEQARLLKNGLMEYLERAENEFAG